MATHPNPKPWTALLDFAANVKTIADHSPELALAVLALPTLATTLPPKPLGTSLPSNRFYLGQRVQVTTDGLGLFSGMYRARIGDLGTVTNVPTDTDTDPDYGVILDNNPTGKRHAFGDEDLTPAA